MIFVPEHHLRDYSWSSTPGETVHIQSWDEWVESAGIGSYDEGDDYALLYLGDSWFFIERLVVKMESVLQKFTYKDFQKWNFSRG